MTYWHFIIIQANLVLFYIIYCWLSNSTNHFKFNRVYLLIAPLVAILLPFFSTTIAPQSATVTLLPTITAFAQPINAISTTSFSFLNIILYLGISISILLFFLNIMRILRFPKGEKLMQLGSVKIYRTTENQSFSFVRSIHINDAETEHLDLVIQHELAHCKQLHTFDLLYFAVIKSLFWYNPIVYLWNNKIRENHEFLADEEVMKSNISFETYARTILSAHFSTKYPHLVSGFNAHSLLHKRIKKMKHKNKSYMKHLILIPALAGGLFVTTSLSNQSENSFVNGISLRVESDTEASFPGGQLELQKYIAKNIKYPETSIKLEEQGTAYIQFTVKKSGKIESVTVLRSSKHDALDNEAIRLIKEMPKWNPETKNGKKIDVQLQLPIKFELN